MKSNYLIDRSGNDCRMSETAGAFYVPPQKQRLDLVQDPESRDILGVGVRVVDREAAILEIEEACKTKTHKKLAFLNAHGANLAFRDPEYRHFLKQFTVFADGIGVDLASKILYGKKFPANLNGTDFIPSLLASLSPGRVISLIGGEPGVAETAKASFASRFPQHKFIVISDGFFDDEKEEILLAGMENQDTDILLVAFGNPKQEKLIAENCTQYHGTVAIGVGALFDFVAGRVPRAPEWMINLRIEWLYRLGLEPRRMWKRYVLGNPLFLARVLKQKLSRFKNGSRSGGQ